MLSKRFYSSLAIVFVLMQLLPIQISAADTNDGGCLYCHQGIEDFTDGPMMIVIKAIAQSFNDPGGCVVCHGGTPSATDKNIAHTSAPIALTDNGGPFGRFLIRSICKVFDIYVAPGSESRYSRLI
jgi:hypothetical protein